MKPQGFANLTVEQVAERNKKALEARKLKNEANKLKRFPTLSQAVRAHCKSCIYDSLNGGSWLDQVTACSVTGCDLYEWRPVKPSPVG